MEVPKAAMKAGLRQRRLLAIKVIYSKERVYHLICNRMVSFGRVASSLDALPARVHAPIR